MKRATTEPPPAAKRSTTLPSMLATRVRTLGNIRNPKKGRVVYWMSRDQRVHDNWAFIYAQRAVIQYIRSRLTALELAMKHHSPLGVVFCLAPSFLGATQRQFGFMLKGSLVWTVTT